MSTPYSTPSFPAAPRLTPASVVSNRGQKAPIYNPYDKFTQNEFDNWIGGITGALRRALGQEGDKEEQEPVTRDYGADLFAPRDDDETEQSPEYEPETQSDAEDSFAEVTTRIDKGKGRDPREGPGLGGRHQPIEILYSDSDEEEDEGEDEIEDDEAGEEREYDWREYDSDGKRNDEYEGSEEEYGEEASGHHDRDDGPEEIIELSSGEEGEDQEPFEDGDVSDSLDAKTTYMLAVAKFGQPLPAQDEDQDAVGDEEEEEDPQEQEDEHAFPPRRSQSQPLDLADPWVGPQTYAEDFYSGGDIREGVLDPALVSPSNLTPVRARSEHTWEEDANGLLPRTPVAVHKETSIIDVDMDEDEKDEDLLNESSPVASSPMGEYNLHQEEYVGREGEHDENDEFRDDEAFDEFLGEEAEGERHTDADSPTPSPEIFIAAQSQMTQVATTPTSSPATYDRSPSATPGPNGRLHCNFPLAFPAGNVTAEPAHTLKSPSNDAPEIIELSDDDEDEGGEHDDNDNDGDNAEQEMEELTSEDEEPIGTTSDLIADSFPKAIIATQETAEEGIVHDDDPAIVEPFAVESKEASSLQTHNGGVEVSADQQSAIRDVTGSPEVISVDDFDEEATEEIHEVPADVRIKASLLASFLASADTMAEPMWNGEAPGEFSHVEHPFPSPVVEVGPVQSNGLDDFIEPSTIEASEEYVVGVGDAESHTENFSGDKTARDISPQLSQEGLDGLQQFNESLETTTTEAPSQAGVHYIVSEVMTDDGRPSTVSPDDRNADVVSVADDQAGKLVPYMVEESFSVTEEPANQDAADDSEVGVTLSLLERSDEDDGSILSIPNHTPDSNIADPVQPTSVASNDFRSDHRNLSADAAANNPDNVGAEPLHTDEPFVQAWENHNDKAGTLYAFPMPISADPSVPDPAGISRTPDTRNTPPKILRDSEVPRDSAQALHDLTTGSIEPSPTVPSFSRDTSVEEESFLNMSASGLFTPQTEANMVPGSPEPQTHATDNAQLTPIAKPEHSTLPESSSIPLEIRDTQDVSNDGAHDINHPLSPPEVAKSLDAAEDEDDPFKLMGNDSKVAPGAVDNQPGFSERPNERIKYVQPLSLEIPREEAISNYDIVNGTGTQVSKDQKATVTATSFYQNGASHSSNGSRRNNSLDSVGGQQKKASKRKRIPPPSIPARLTRSMSSKTSPAMDHKGKAKAEDDTPSENGSNSSGASVASRMLRVASGDTSRASSVVSTAQSVESSAFSVQQSPTLTRQSSNFKSNLPVLYHAHSGIHHHHSRPSTVPRPSQTQKHPVASSSHSADVSAQPGASQPSPSQRTAVTHSPVTRSNCRFHRISLPREEGGPRVSFIVPGCSLGDRTLMEEEDIHDEGDATTVDHARMVGDIETLDFSSDLVGVLRQLVGVDLLRENEIFFLPQPGESYRRKHLGKSKLYTARPSSGDLISSPVSQTVAPSPREPKSSKISPSPSLVQAPVSVAGSASTSAGSTGWKGRQIDRYSPSVASHSDDEAIKRDNGGASKRRKGASAKRNGVASSEEMPPPSSDAQSRNASAKRPAKARRSKRISIDAHAYNPEAEVEETSTDHDGEMTKGRRKKTGKRGIKRNRTSEMEGGEGGPEQPMAKRLRGRPSTSSNGGR